MRNASRTVLNVSAGALVLGGFLALASSAAYGPLVLIVPVTALCLWPLGEWLDGRHALYGKAAAGLNTLAFLAIPLLFLGFDKLTSVVILISYIEVYTLVRRKARRNYQHLFLMTLFLVLAASVRSPEPAIALAMLLCLVAAVVCSIALNVHFECAGSPTPPVTDSRPVDAPRSGDEVPPRVRGWLFYSVASAALCVLVIILAAAAFAVMPRTTAGVLGRATVPVHITGLSAEVDLSTGGQIQQDDRIVMHVQFPDQPDGVYPGELFWRTSALEQYGNARWERHYSRYGDTTLGQGFISTGDSTVERTFRLGGTLVRQSVFMDDMPAHGLPFLPFPLRVDARRGSLNWGGGGDYTVYVSGRGQRTMEYEVVSEVRPHDVEDLRSAPDDYEDAIPSGTHDFLTRHDLLPETVELARAVTRDADNVYDKMRAIERYLNSPEFSYSLNVPDPGLAHPIDLFLRVHRMGHCELYASAAALMLRSLGVPTRVVSGYRGGEWSDAEKAYVVRGDMAHLWVEVYFLGHGWVTFDPSPPDERVGYQPLRDAMRLISRQLMRGRMFWYQNVVGYDRGMDLASLRRLQLSLVPWRWDLRGGGPSGAAEAGQEQALGTSQAVPAVAAMLAAVALAVFVVRGKRARLGMSNGLDENQARARRVYHRLERELRRVGKPCDNRTAEEIRQDVESNGFVGAETVAKVLQTYNEARFGSRPLDTGTFAGLMAEVRGLRRVQRRARRA